MTRSAQPADFYRAAGYASDESVGHLMKRILVSMAYQSDDLLDPYALTSAQCGPLMHLKTAGHSTVAELARSLQLDAGATTRLLDRLERKGYCKRVRCCADRRVVKVELTPEGEAAISKVPAIRCQVMNDHLASFSNGDWNALKLYLVRMAQNADELRTPDAAAALVLSRQSPQQTVRGAVRSNAPTTLRRS